MSSRSSKVYSVLMIAIFLILVFLVTESSQNFDSVQAEPSLSLSYYKNNGYGFGKDINGIWTITALVSQNVSYVTFYLDNQLQQNDSSSPFSWNFNTNNYTLGLHTISVTAYDSLGEAETVEVQRNFVGFPTELLVGIIGLIVGIIAVLVFVAVYQIRKNNKEKQ
jgi:ABC-type phosphate transport system permease subunit